MINWIRKMFVDSEKVRPEVKKIIESINKDEWQDVWHGIEDPDYALYPKKNCCWNGWKWISDSRSIHVGRDYISHFKINYSEYWFLAEAVDNYWNRRRREESDKTNKTFQEFIKDL